MKPVLKRLLSLLGGAALAAPAFASDGSSSLALNSSNRVVVFICLLVGLLSIGVAGLLSWMVLSVDAGSPKMREVGEAIRSGAVAYLTKQVRTMIWFVILLVVGLFFLFRGPYGSHTALLISLCFVFGVTSSYIAGFCGMLIAVNGNMRVANSARKSSKLALETAFRSGAVTGVLTVGLAILGESIIFLSAGTDSLKLLVGYGFGCSLAALFMRVGGGIFTKAADVGADLVGKVEAGIPEDDPRNPAVIADNVGDNVGDCAGMAADVFESYSVTLVASILLGAATSEVVGTEAATRLILFSLVVSAIGILGSIVGIAVVRGSELPTTDPLKLIRRGFLAAAALSVVGIIIAAPFVIGKTPLQGSQLISLEKLQRDEYAPILAIRDALAAQKKEPAYKVTAEEVQNTPAFKNLPYSEDEKKALIGPALNFRRADAAAIPNMDGYRPVDFNDPNDPVLSYTVLPPATSPTTPTNPDTLLNTYSTVGRDGKRVQAGIALYSLTAHYLQPQGGQTPPDQTAVLGPLPQAEMQKQLDALNGSGKIQVKVNEVVPCTLYENPSNGLLAIGYNLAQAKPPLKPGTAFPVASIARQNFTYFKGSVADVAAAIQTQAPAATPPQFQASLAEATQTDANYVRFLIPVIFGVILAFMIERLTDYYVSTKRKPTQEVAGVSSAGAAPMIIQGFSYGLESSVFMVVAIVVALMVPMFVFPHDQFGNSYILSFFGVALVGLGLLTTTGFVLAMDTFGPISDNAQGVYEMSGEGTDGDFGSKVVQHLDAAGNTTKALTKGFAITTAVIAAVALFHSFLQDAHLGSIGLRLDFPEIFLGLLIGGAAPFLFSAFSINAVGRAAFELINEVRAQFKNDPGIMKGTSKPDYAKCVSIVTAAAQRELLGPGILAIALPAAVGFGFSIGKPVSEINGQYFNLYGAEALGGFLAGAILSGQLMAVLLANSGGMWDNAKKIVEDGLYGGKGSDAHKAAVVCDTVGDPFKDTAGPALNPLIKVMNLVAVLIAPTIILPLGNISLSLITAVCVAALIVAIAVSKKGSLSQSLQQAETEAEIVEVAAQKREYSNNP